MSDPTPLQGELYWIAPDVLHPSRPFARPDTPPGSHPHLVLSADVFNRSRLDLVVVCALTTRLRTANEPGAVLLEPGEGGLPQHSVVLPTQICRVAKADLGARIGSLSAERVEQALAGLRFVQRLGTR